MFIDLREREEGGERDRLPPISTLTGDWNYNLGVCPDQDQTHHLLVYGTTLQPTEPPGQGLNGIFSIF